MDKCRHGLGSGVRPVPGPHPHLEDEAVRRAMDQLDARHGHLSIDDPADTLECVVVPDPHPHAVRETRKAGFLERVLMHAGQQAVDRPAADLKDSFEITGQRVWHGRGAPFLSIDEDVILDFLLRQRLFVQDHLLNAASHGVGHIGLGEGFQVMRLLLLAPHADEQRGAIRGRVEADGVFHRLFAVNENGNPFRRTARAYVLDGDGEMGAARPPGGISGGNSGAVKTFPPGDRETCQERAAVA